MVLPSTPPSGVGPRSTMVTSRPRSRQTEATSQPIKPPPATSTSLGLLAKRPDTWQASPRLPTTNPPPRKASSASSFSGPQAGERGSHNANALRCDHLIDMTGHASSPSVRLHIPHHPDRSGLPGPDRLWPRVSHPSAALHRALDHTLTPLHYGNETRQEPQTTIDQNSDSG